MPSTRSVTTKNALFALLIIFLAIAGCNNSNTLERARLRGEINGKIDGQRMGESEGYQSAYQPANDAAYKNKINELISSKNYRRKRAYTLIVLAGTFLFGFSLQYLILYGLRRNEFLFDIDRIVLPKGNTQVDLVSVLSSHQSDETLALKQPDASSHD